MNWEWCNDPSPRCFCTLNSKLSVDWCLPEDTSYSLPSKVFPSEWSCPLLLFLLTQLIGFVSAPYCHTVASSPSRLGLVTSTPLPLIIFCGPQWFRVGRLFSVRTKQPKAEWEWLGLCQSQGSDWRYKPWRKDWSSWIASVWPQLNTRSPIKRRPGSIDQAPPSARHPLLLTRSVNPLLNVRRHSVYGLNWHSWCAHSGVSSGKRFH